MKVIFFSVLTVLGVWSSLAFAHEEARLAPLQEVTLTDGRHILATSSGLTVYVFDNDKKGVSTCYEACAKAWPPVLVKSASDVKAPMGAVARKGGVLQLTFKGRPLYLYYKDQKPGDIYGDGIDGVWHIIVD